MAKWRFIKCKITAWRREKTGNNPTDRSKLGTKRHVICEGNGIPISLCLTGANVHDINVLSEMITEIAVERPLYLESFVNLCLDKGYKSKNLEELIFENRMRPHIPKKGKALIINDPKKKPRRWNIERTVSWLNRYRRLLIRWEKNPGNYTAFTHIACCIITLSKLFPG